MVALLALAPLTPVRAEVEILLPGELTVESGTPMRMDFTIPSATEVVSDWFGESEQVSIGGSGRAIGAVITDRTPGSKPHVLLLLSVDRCFACPPDTDRVEFVTSVGFYDEDASSGDRRVDVLPAGSYSLHMITDGSPVAVHLSFPGLSGVATWEPTRATSLTWKSYEDDISGAAGPHPYVSKHGASPIAGRYGVLFNYLSFVQYPYVSGYWQDCYYRDAGPPGDLMLPLCPFGIPGTLGNFDYIGPPATGAAYRYAVAVTPQPGVWTQGWYAATVPGSTETVAHGFWLDPYIL